MLQWTCGCLCLFEPVLSLNTYSGVGLPDKFFFLGISIVFHSSCTNFILTNSAQGFSFHHINTCYSFAIFLIYLFSFLHIIIFRGLRSVSVNMDLKYSFYLLHLGDKKYTDLKKYNSYYLLFMQEMVKLYGSRSWR